jgi:hypothetical protein
MKLPSAPPAFSPLSIGLLVVAVASALLSLVRDEFPVLWTGAAWICGISVLALLGSLIHDMRR